MDVTSLVKTLEPVPGLVDEHGELVKATPAEDSPAARDAARPEGHRIWIIANQLWGNGAEHLVVWRDLILKARVHPRSAQYTLLRGTFEGIVTCRYLVDEGAGQAVRISRACAQQLEDWRQRKNFESQINLPDRPLPAKRAHQRIDDLRRSMVANGVTEIPMPSFVERFRTHGDGEWLYRVLSAHAHGFEWSLMTARIKPVEDATPWVGSGAGMVEASEDMTLQMTALAVAQLAESFAELKRYAGRG